MTDRTITITCPEGRSASTYALHIAQRQAKLHLTEDINVYELNFQEAPRTSHFLAICPCSMEEAFYSPDEYCGAMALRDVSLDRFPLQHHETIWHGHMGVCGNCKRTIVIGGPTIIVEKLDKSALKGLVNSSIGLQRALAEALIDLAEQCMPDSYLETDSRVALAKKCLKLEKEIA